MPISDLIRAGVSRLTPQQLADLALSSDQQARRARRAGRHADANAAELESLALATLMNMGN